MDRPLQLIELTEYKVEFPDLIQQSEKNVVRLVSPRQNLISSRRRRKIKRAAFISFGTLIAWLDAIALSSEVRVSSPPSNREVGNNPSYLYALLATPLTRPRCLSATGLRLLRSRRIYGIFVHLLYVVDGTDDGRSDAELQRSILVAHYTLHTNFPRLRPL